MLSLWALAHHYKMRLNYLESVPGRHQVKEVQMMTAEGDTNDFESQTERRLLKKKSMK